MGGGTRFFLADLPTRTTEHDIKSLFQDYGHVERVELKTKEQFMDSGGTSTKVIAFVTLQTDDPHYCLNELSWQKLNGAKLNISLAKESFLDRLKRERDEEQQNEKAGGVDYEAQPSSELLTRSTKNKRRVFGEDEELNDDDIAPELLITKKRAAGSMQNGKIVIQQEYDVTPLHIIEQHKKPAKQQLDAKATIADAKRKESLNKMKQQYDQKKSAIQQALSAVDAGKSKRIKFSDAESEEEEKEPAVQKKKAALFDEDDDEEEEEHILPQYQGKTGERLVELQSKQSLDPRFRITANFVEQQEGEEEEDEEQQNEPLQESERAWQLGILEQVVGKKIDTTNAHDAAKSANNKKMLRFDPGKAEHQKLLRKTPAVAAKQSKQQVVAKVAEEIEAAAPVSKTAFYMVTDTLKQSLNRRGEGFSLLEMFGSDHDAEAAQRQDQLQKLSNERIVVNKSNKLGFGTLNPFSYDSSESEDEGAAADQPTADKEQKKQPPANPNRKPKKAKLFTETFFIPKNDARLKEGAKFFKFSKTDSENVDYDQVRNRLKLLITNKIAKTKKNLPGGGVKKRHQNKQKH